MPRPLANITCVPGSVLYTNASSFFQRLYRERKSVHAGFVLGTYDGVTVSTEREQRPSSLKDTIDRFRVFGDKRLQSVARIEAALLSGARRYFVSNDFTEVLVPHITRATGACENIATMFDVSFFGERRYLAQTGQLYLEVLTPYLKKVWASGPSFRAEPDVDDRHLVEFNLVELEFEGGFEQLLSHIEGMLVTMIQEVIGQRRNDLELLGSDVAALSEIQAPFRRITYTEAVGLIQETGVSWGDDLKSAHEKWLVNHFGGKPLFITHYPKAIKFFNMKENMQDPNLVDSADLILPNSGEAVGAAERESDHDKLRARLMESSMLRLLRERGGDIDDFDWYLNFYKENGGCQHSGCGMGMNRVTQSIVGAADIRETTVWPMNRESNV